MSMEQRKSCSRIVSYDEEQSDIAKDLYAPLQEAPDLNEWLCHLSQDKMKVLLAGK